ncbi:MAG: protein TolR [Betaproteobacteria bacterium]|nr:protein TolR [Betaproteobacteria bacterium]
MINSRRKRFNTMSQINVVPYIDVMLVLLVIFMVTAPMMNPGLVDLPEVGKSSAPPPEPLEVSIKVGGQVVLIDRMAGGSARSVTQTELVREIRKALEAKPDRPVVIGADQRVEYGKVMKVMDLLQQEGIPRVGLLTRPRSN